MTRGPKPQPTKYKILRGNPGKRQLNDQEPEPVPKLPPPPKHLSESARKAWELLAPQLDDCGATSRIDGVAFELLCTSYGGYLDSCANVAKFGAVYIDKPPGSKIPETKYSPWYKMANVQFDQVRSMLLEFGMTPCSRSKVVRTRDTRTDNADKFFGVTG